MFKQYTFLRQWPWKNVFTLLLFEKGPGFVNKFYIYFLPKEQEPRSKRVFFKCQVKEITSLNQMNKHLIEKKENFLSIP